MHLANELFEHLLGDGEVGDDAILHRADDGNRPRSLAKHVLGPLTDGLNALLGIRPAFHANGHNGRLVEHDTLAANIDQGVGRSQVNRQIARKITAQKTEHAYLSVKTPQSVRQRKQL